MGRNSKIAVAAILALAIASCATSGEQQVSNPTPTTPAETKPPAATQSFNNPVVPAKQTSPVAQATPILIQPTNATERVVVVSKGRSDPFGQILPPMVAGTSNTTTSDRLPVLPPQPAFGSASISERKLPRRSAVISVGTRRLVNPQNNKINKRAIARLVNPQNNKISKRAIARLVNPQNNKINKRAIASARTPSSFKPSSGFTPVIPKVLPQVVPNPTLVSVLPPPVQPDLAKAVIVTGIVVVSNEAQAIIKVPNEPTSRYVQVGQRLANGLLVKRIEINEGSNPVVILEQYGIEVARTVGEAPINSTSSTTASENPVSVTKPPQNPVNTGAS